MKILIISYYYAPLSSPRAFRWTSIAEHLASQGNEVHVICSCVGEAPSHEQKNNVSIYRAGNKKRMLLGYMVEHLGIPQSRAPTYWIRLKSCIKTTFYFSLRFIYHKTWKQVCWPDYASLWIRPAFRMAKNLLEKNQYDCFVSVSHPFSSHVVGRKIKKLYPALPWIVDLGDPFCFTDLTPPNNLFLYRRFNRWYEENVFKLANHIVTTTSFTSNAYLKLFQISRKKISDIPPMCSFVPVLNSARQPSSNKLVLAYIGTLYCSIRSPEFLLLLFLELKKLPENDGLELHFYGAINDCKTLFNDLSGLSNKKIFLHGMIDREKLVHVIESVDVLINIGNKTSYQVPSKLVEYVHFRKPILNIIYHQNDSSLDLLRGYPLIENVLIGEDNLQVTAVQKISSYLRQQRTDIDDIQIENLSKRFSVNSVVMDYFNVFQSVQGR